MWELRSSNRIIAGRFKKTMTGRENHPRFGISCYIDSPRDVGDTSLRRLAMVTPSRVAGAPRRRAQSGWSVTARRWLALLTVPRVADAPLRDAHLNGVH